MSSKAAISPSFVESAEGRLFVMEYIPDASVDRHHAIIFVPPFAEEMNRCRVTVSRQARALAEIGFRPIVFDLYGTGESGGDFSEASWAIWCKNISAIVEHCAGAACDQYSFVAIRFGALLLLDRSANLLDRAGKVVLWQPCTTGKSFLRQFLRLRIASQMTSNTADKETVGQLMSEFTAGSDLEIGGYSVSPQLALAIESADLSSFGGANLPPVFWFDMVPAVDSELAVVSQNVIRRWRSLGVGVDAVPVIGERFWSTVETTIATNLIDETTALFVEGGKP